VEVVQFFKQIFKEINAMHLINSMERGNFLQLKGISIEINQHHFANLALYSDLMERDLKHFVQEHSEPKQQYRTKLKILQQIALGLVQLEDLKTVHGDLKPENVLLDKDDNAHIADFGTAKTMHSTSYSMDEKLLCTPAYSPPELIQGGARNDRTDVWAFGCIMLYVLSGVSPYANVLRDDKLAYIKSMKESVVDNYLNNNSINSSNVMIEQKLMDMIRAATEFKI
jgi:serine/threonine protein kinase